MRGASIGGAWLSGYALRAKVGCGSANFVLQHRIADGRARWPASIEVLSLARAPERLVARAADRVHRGAALAGQQVAERVFAGLARPGEVGRRHAGAHALPDAALFQVAHAVRPVEEHEVLRH